MPVETIKWVGDANGYAELIDQTLLPGEFRMVAVRDPQTMWQAIKTLQVRGAPAIGIAAAYGVVLGLQKVDDNAPASSALRCVEETTAYLATSRPTAVNLFWALDRMQHAAEVTVSHAGSSATTAKLKTALLDQAQAIRSEDAATCRAIGGHGAVLIKDGHNLLTHCNAGGLATADYGTALAPMFTAHEQGRRFRVYVDETRPLLQGARLTAWELLQAGISATLICDNMAGFLMQQKKVDLIITGADRIAANGDTANKIGTYSLAVLARVHGIPFYIAAPSSTFDLSIPDGGGIPIEERLADEVRSCGPRVTAPAEVEVYNPAFDVTPRDYITGIITERGIITRPDREAIAGHLGD